MLAFLLMAMSSVDIRLVSDGPLVYPIVPIRVGAAPGELKECVITGGQAIIQSSDSHNTQFAIGGTDIVYIDDKVVRLQTGNVTTSSIGWEELSAYSSTWGVCDNKLYTRHLPRHCRIGRSGGTACYRNACPISVNSYQHEGVCVGNRFKFSFEGLDVVTTCGQYPGLNFDTVVNSNENSIVSVWQSKLNFEYNDDTATLVVWERIEDVSDMTETISMLAILVFLAIWTSWTRDLHAAINTRNVDKICNIWRTVAWNSLFIADAASFAAGTKVYHLIVQSKMFFSESIDDLLGEDIATAYSYIYIGIVLLSAVVLCIAMGIILTSEGYSILPPIDKAARPFISACKSWRNRSAVLVGCRWGIEFILLTALHITTPVSFGQHFRNIVGLSTGITVSTIAGRDANTMMRIVQSSLPRFLIQLFFGICITHSTIFMTYPTLAISPGASKTTAVAMSLTLTLSGSCAGALWAYLSAKRVESHSPDVDNVAHSPNLA